MIAFVVISTVLFLFATVSCMFLTVVAARDQEPAIACTFLAYTTICLGMTIYGAVLWSKF